MENFEACLLTRSWFDQRDGVRLAFWGASARGPLRLVFTGQQPVMFVERHLPSASGRRKPLELRSFYGRPVDALYFDTQRELTAERARVRDALGLTIPVGHIHTPVMTRFLPGNDALLTDSKYEAYRAAIVQQGRLLVESVAKSL